MQYTSSTVSKVKVILYEDSIEAAWVIFDKKLGSSDSWFQPLQIMDSYPWNTEMLKSSSEVSLEPQQYNDNTRFYIVESNTNFYLREWSPHRYWMEIHEEINPIDDRWTECEYGIVDQPHILYKKGPYPVLLSKSRVSHVAK